MKRDGTVPQTCFLLFWQEQKEQSKDSLQPNPSKHVKLSAVTRARTALGEEARTREKTASLKLENPKTETTQESLMFLGAGVVSQQHAG